MHHHTISRILPAAFAGMLALSGQSGAHSPATGNSAAATFYPQGTFTLVVAKDGPAGKTLPEDPMKKIIEEKRARLAQDVADSCEVPRNPENEIHIMREMQNEAKKTGMPLDQYVFSTAKGLDFASKSYLADPNYRNKLHATVSYFRVDQGEENQLNQAFQNAGVKDPKARQTLVDYVILTSYDPALCARAVVSQKNFETEAKESGY